MNKSFEWKYFFKKNGVDIYLFFFVSFWF